MGKVDKMTYPKEGVNMEELQQLKSTIEETKSLLLDITYQTTANILVLLAISGFIIAALYVCIGSRKELSSKLGMFVWSMLFGAVIMYLVKEVRLLLTVIQ